MLGTKKHKLLLRIPTHLLFVFDAFSLRAAFFTFLSVSILTFNLKFDIYLWKFTLWMSIIKCQVCKISLAYKFLIQKLKSKIQKFKRHYSRDTIQYNAFIVNVKVSKPSALDSVSAVKMMLQQLVCHPDIFE